jgi:hypothetical protein
MSRKESLNTFYNDMSVKMFTFVWATNTQTQPRTMVSAIRLQFTSLPVKLQAAYRSPCSAIREELNVNIAKTAVNHKSHSSTCFKFTVVTVVENL